MKQNPFYEMRKLKKEMDKIFEKSFNFYDLKEPYSDIKENENELIFEMNLPELKKEDIQVLIKGKNLEIKVGKKSELKIKNKGYSKEESSYRGLHKVMTLPCKINPEESESEFKEGVLRIIMPKAEKKKLRKIEIK